MPPRRAILGLLPPLLLLLAACGSSDPETPIVLRAEARLPGPDRDLIEVLVTEIPPGTVIDAVILYGPNGEQLSGAEVSRRTLESGPGLVSRPTIGVGVTGGSSSGINPSIGLGWGVTGGGGPSRRTQQISYVILLPPDVNYLDQPQAWRIELQYRDVTGAPRQLLLPGPA